MLERGQSRKHKKDPKRLIIDNRESSGAPEIKREEIEELELVGSGQYGHVYRGRCRGIDVAIKILKNKVIGEHELTSFKHEVEIMSRIRFPNVCLLLGACTDPNYFCIVQEFLSGGDLASIVEKKKFSNSFYARMRLGSQIARGMLWVHSNSVLHRDLKLENLLLDKYGEVKVCDFGLSDITGDNVFIWDEGRKGSPLYSAPEVLLKKGLNTKVDVYSFGLVLYEVLAQHRVFQHHLKHNDINIFTDAICKTKERPPLPPPECVEDAEEWKDPYLIKLLNSCWSDKASERPSFAEIYDELNTLIVDGLIKDHWGRIFWLVNFPDNDSVSWDQFVKTIKFSKSVELQDGSTFCRGLAIKDSEIRSLECLKLIFAHVSGIKRDFNTVTCENFGKLLAWFGPGIEERPQRKTFLDRIIEICSQPWFHGNPDNPNGLLSVHKDSFLVRLSGTPGFFTIQHQSWKVRIEYVPKFGFRENNDNSTVSPFFPNLAQWVNEKVNKRNLTPLPNSEFQNIFSGGVYFSGTAYIVN